jgi:hypothetical protein
MDWVDALHRTKGHGPMYPLENSHALTSGATLVNSANVWSDEALATSIGPKPMVRCDLDAA